MEFYEQKVLHSDKQKLGSIQNGYFVPDEDVVEYSKEEIDYIADQMSKSS